MPTWVDHLLVLALAVFFPIRASTFGYRRLAMASPESVARVRRSLYVQALWLQWGLAALLLALWMWRARGWEVLGLAARPTPWFKGIAGGSVVIAAFLLFQARQTSGNERALARVMKRLERVERMLPHTREELRTFFTLSATAGVCEELLYRGFLLWYLGHWLGPVASLALASLLFGIGHSYQGWRGMVLTGLVGAILGVVYLAAGSLYPAMLLHAAGDMHAGTIAQAALSRRSGAGSE